MTKRITFSGAAIPALRYAIELACDKVHNQIGAFLTCMRAEDIAAYEADLAQLKALLARIDKASGARND